MSYTEWIRKTFPSMHDASSVETCRLIHEAREQSRVWRALLLLPTMALVLMFGRLGGALVGGELFGTGLKNWLLSVVAFAAAFAIKEVLDRFIIKARIRRAIHEHGEHPGRVDEGAGSDDGDKGRNR